MGDPCGSNPQLSPVDSLRASQLDTALFDSSAINVLAGTRIFQSRSYIWEQMYSNNMYNGASSLARDFYDQQSNLATGRFTRVDAALSRNDIATAQNENTFLPSNTLEQRQQQVNDVRIKMADTSQQLVSGDTAVLYAIANGCPEIDGTAVYDARTLLNLLYGQSLFYSSNCIDSNSYRLADVKRFPMLLEANKLKVFPNPSNGTFKCSIVGTGSSEISIELQDGLGDVVLKKNVVLNEEGEFVLENISVGAYPKSDRAALSLKGNTNRATSRSALSC